MRKYGAGQIDLAHYQRGKIYLYELKSSEIGILNTVKGQHQRLLGSMLIVENITRREVSLKYLKKGFAN